MAQNPNLFGRGKEKDSAFNKGKSMFSSFFGERPKAQNQTPFQYLLFNKITRKPSIPYGRFQLSK
jgi:hypothetical protein